MAAGPARRGTLGGALHGFVAEGERIVGSADKVAPLATDPDSGCEDAALGAYAVLAVGCKTNHDRAPKHEPCHCAGYPEGSEFVGLPWFDG